jgi:anti-anti-sigma regulatory factor
MNDSSVTASISVVAEDWSERRHATGKKTRSVQKERCVSVTLEQNDVLSTIHLEGAIDIVSAGELKALLLEALGSGRPVRAVLEGTTGLDVTAMQLLWAARQTARASEVGFAIGGQAQERISAALAAAGLEDFMAEVVANE